MDGEAGFERALRQAAGVTGVAGAFQAVDQDEIRFRWTFGMLGMDQDLDTGFGGKEAGLDREALDVQLSRPEVSGDGG